MSGGNKIKANVYTIHNKVKLVRGGTAYFNQIEEIAAGAEFSILLQTYIFDEDETGKKVADAMMKAATRGVKVYMLVDAFASQHLSEHFIKSLTVAGIHFSFFKPVFKTRDFYIGRRLHHKVIVADAMKCMVAGLNISNRYNDINGRPAWMDWAIYAEGEVAQQLHKVCTSVWNRSVFRENVDVWVEKLPQSHPLPPEMLKEVCLVKICKNDWIYRQTEITKSYYELFKSVHEKAILMTGYFWPSKRLLRKMDAAARKGAKLQLILTEISDVPLAKAAERYTYRRLLRNRIRVFEYHNNVLHGKIGVFDAHTVTGGSYNINNISARASVELNLVVKNEQFAQLVEDTLQHIITDDCKEITLADCNTKYGIFSKLNQWLSYHIIHFVFYLFTFYFRQERPKH